MRFSELVLHIVAIIVVVTMALAFVWIKNEQIRLGYIYSKRFSNYRELKELNEKLQLEWEYLTDYVRLEKIAKREFNLRKPTRNEIIHYLKNRK